MAAQLLLELPDELLVQILAFLPARALLKFAQTSRFAHALANSNLHILELGIRPIRAKRLIRTFGRPGYIPARNQASALVDASALLPNESSNRSSVSPVDPGPHEPCDNDIDHDKIWVRIPDAHTYEYSTLHKFNTALVCSILLRHGNMLQTVDLSLWALTLPIANAIADLPALRNLSISIEDDIYARAVPRSLIALERFEQCAAWNQLVKNAVWKNRLRILQIKTADVTTPQLARLLKGNYRCQELCLSGCDSVGQELWAFLSSEWRGVAALRTLVVVECGGILDETTVEMIGKLSQLQVCIG